MTATENKGSGDPSTTLAAKIAAGYQSSIMTNDPDGSATISIFYSNVEDADKAHEALSLAVDDVINSPL